MVIGVWWVGCPWIYSGNEEQRYDFMSFPANKTVFSQGQIRTLCELSVLALWGLRIRELRNHSV